jgi:hypothetical protein
VSTVTTFPGAYPIREYYCQQTVTKKLYESKEWDEILSKVLTSCMQEIESDEHFFQVVQTPTVKQTLFYSDIPSQLNHFPTDYDSASLVELHIHGYVAGTWPVEEDEDESEWTVIKKQEAIERVRDLHYEYPDTGDCAGCNHIYPCPTIKALDGEQVHKLTENEHGNTCRDVLCGGCVEFIDGE